MTKSKLPLILAIDTSCDETAVAVTQGLSYLSNVVASQVQLHKQYGGVFPTVAKQAHQENLPACTVAALRQAHVTWDEIDQIAVTQGPGLAPALEVGLEFAATLAENHHKPLVGINHIEGHIWSVLTTPQRATQATVELAQVAFPVLSVIVSGKHTDFILVTAPGQYQRLGWTIDDAAGECLDKVGRMLGLGYPAGPVIEEFARLGDPHSTVVPLPMTTSGDYNLSFSGLKTFARNFIEARQLSRQETYDLCASMQSGIFRHITHKLSKILNDYPDLGEVWVGGGVAANISLRSTLRQTLRERGKKLHTHPLKLRAPYSKKLCGDNAAMIGVAAGIRPHELASGKLERLPRWAVDEKL